MLSQWFKQHHSHKLVGLDLGSDSIKIVEINSTSKPFKLEKLIAYPLPPGAFVKGEIKDSAQLQKALKEAFRKANIENKTIAFSIPRSLTVTKNVKVDSRLTPSEIESRAWIEANHHFPDLVGEIYLDFSIENQEDEKESELDVMLVACRKDQINPFLETFTESGLIPKVIDVNSYALERALLLLTEESKELNTVALLNIDNSLTTLLVLHNQKLIYAHDHNFDAARLISQTNEYLQKNSQKVATINDLEYFEIMKNNLTAHLRHTIHFFYSSRPAISIQKLFLSGDCARIPGLIEFAQQEIGIDTLLADPLQQMVIDPEMNKNEIQQSAPTMMLAIGLALSKL